MSNAKRKYAAIDVVKLYATLGRPKWESILRNAADKNSVNKLIAWRYGLQAGLADANARGKITTQKMDIWVLSRIKEVEKTMKEIIKRNWKSLADKHIKSDVENFTKIREDKRKRDREFETFLMKSNF